MAGQVNRAVWIIIAASLLLRTALAGVTPIVTDEAYAIAVGRSFSISFFDHPPIGFWLPAIVETCCGARSPLAYRVPSLVLGSISIYLLYLLGRELHSHRAGLWSATLGALAPIVALAGVLILPDAPLLVFTLLTVLLLLKIAKAPRAQLWVMGGIALALALASKYQAGLIPISVLLWMLSCSTGRRWFARPGFYVAISISLLGLLPVLIWNLQNGWASFMFHSGRAGGGVSVGNFGLMALGQSLYLLPVVAILGVQEIIDRANWQDPHKRLLVLIALGPIVMFNIIYLFSRGTLPHWSTPGWICLFPLIGIRLATADFRRIKLANFVTAGALYTLLFVLSTHLATGWLTNSRPVAPNWDRTAPNVSLDALRNSLAQSDVLADISVIAAADWIQAGYFAAALPFGPPVRVIDDAPHHFGFMAGATAFGPAVLLDLVDAADAEARQTALLNLAQSVDANAQPLHSIAVARGPRDHFRIIAVSLLIPQSSDTP